MCLIVFALGVRHDAPLVLGANRDEAHARRTAPAEVWPESPDVIGGRDLDRGGSWLLATRDGRLAAVTNHRRVPLVSRGPSRGWLVRDFVLGKESARDYVRRRRTEDFASFNLLVFDGAQMWQLEDDRGARPIEPGIHGLSNARLDDPWPKVTRTKAALERSIRGSLRDVEEAIFRSLEDREGADDGALPDTGVGLEIERALAPPFIVSPVYGTRSSSVVVIGTTDLSFEERTFDPEGRMVGRQRIELKIERRFALSSTS
jgi:uncharacterized protein with NRDE domain